MRRLMIVPFALLLLTIIGFVLGFVAQASFFLVISPLCLAPLFLLTLGFALGKASHDYQFFVPKATAQPIVQQRRTRAASYDVGSGEIRGS